MQVVMVDLKNDYEKLRKKYSLPKYDELDENFELLYFQPVIEIKFLLRFIRRRIFDKINSYIVFLQNILHPNPNSIISLEESRFFSDNEKQEIANLMKSMMQLERKSSLIDLSGSEKEDAEFIKKAFNSWVDYKKSLYGVSKKMLEGWYSEVKEDSKSTFFG